MTLRLLHDIDDPDTIANVVESLREYLQRRSSKVGPLRLLVDLRACAEFRASHAVRIVAILVTERQSVLAHLRASALVMSDVAGTVLEDMRSMFQRLYTPARPFSIFENEAEAVAFLARVPGGAAATEPLA